MIDPGVHAPGRDGAPGRPITIRALNDGAVTIDGEYARRPVHLNANNWWVFEGFDARKGKCVVIGLSAGSSNNAFRRVIAYDTSLGVNCHVVSLQQKSENNVFEDFAAFGTGRKMFEAYSGSNNTSCRRCWFDHQGDTRGGSLAATMLYKSKSNTLENVLVTASGAVQPYGFRDGFNRLRTEYHRFPSAILGIDRLEETSTPKRGFSKVLGAIVYTKSTDVTGPTAYPWGRVSLFGASSLTVRDVIAVMDPTHPLFNEVAGIRLNRRSQNCAVGVRACEDPVVDNTASNLTSIRGAIPDFVHDDWTVTNHVQGSSLAAVVALDANPWTGTRGAQVCYRYQAGQLTSEPLWPWPMNNRIKVATGRAGRYTGPCPGCTNRDGAPYISPVRGEVDVTADIEALLGAIPEACKSSGR
jgi:hypothetical protein